MKAILLRNWLTVVLSFVSTLSPIHSMKEAIPQPHPTAVVVKLPQKNLAVMPLEVKPIQEKAPLLASALNYTYTFTGQATIGGQPCSNTRVEIRVTSDKGSDIENVTTGADGRYSVSIPVTGEP